MLELSNVHAYYGESHILQGIELKVAPSQCVAILGRNGAGKTTTLRSILGLVPARQGRIVFQGQDITRTATYRIVRSGMAFVPENRGIFANVSVEEHLAIARSAASHRPARKPIEHVYEVFPRLAERRQSLGGQLSGGEQQMLAVGRALIAGPDLMVLDEPSEGLAPVIVETLERVLMSVKTSGIPILLVEQNYHLATRLADYVYVLSQGRVQFAGETSELLANEDVRRTYLSV